MLDAKSLQIVEKLLRLALCPSAMEGEWQSAATKLILTLRKNNTTAEDFLKLKDKPRQSSPRQSSSESNMMPFGKYKGELLAVIAGQDPDYLHWVLEKCANIRPNLRHAIERELGI